MEARTSTTGKPLRCANALESRKMQSSLCTPGDRRITSRSALDDRTASGCGLRGWLDALEFDGEAHHVDIAFQRAAVKGAGEHNVGRISFNRNVDGKAEFVDAEVAANDAGGAVLAGGGSREGAVARHIKI